MDADHHTILCMQFVRPCGEAAIDQSPDEGQWCRSCEVGAGKVAERMEVDVVYSGNQKLDRQCK